MCTACQYIGEVYMYVYCMSIHRGGIHVCVHVCQYIHVCVLYVNT